MNNILINNEWFKNEIKKEIKNYLETNENEHNRNPKSMGHREGSPKRQVHSNEAYLQKVETFQINNLTLYL